jgi:VanZ family protein
VFPFLSKNAVLITVLIGLTLAAGTELMQDCFIPSRTGSIYDFIANAVGCFLGWWVYSKTGISFSALKR